MPKRRATTSIAPVCKRQGRRGTGCAEARGTTSWDGRSPRSTGADQRQSHHHHNAKYPDRTRTCGGNNGRGCSQPSLGPTIMPSTVSALVVTARASLLVPFGRKIHHHADHRRRHPMAAGVLRDHSTIRIRSEKAGQYNTYIICASSTGYLLQLNKLDVKNVSVRRQKTTLDDFFVA